MRLAEALRVEGRPRFFSCSAEYFGMGSSQCNQPQADPQTLCQLRFRYKHVIRSKLEILTCDGKERTRYSLAWSRSSRAPSELRIAGMEVAALGREGQSGILDQIWGGMTG